MSKERIRMKTVFSCTFLIVFMTLSVRGITFSRCDLAKALLTQGFPRSQLENWVCLVEAESTSSTSAKGGPNRDGSYDWGLFQINDRYWCKSGHAGGDCKIACEELRRDDITKASKCAKLVYKRHGFFAWDGWKNKCQRKLPDLTPCHLNDPTNA